MNKIETYNSEAIDSILRNLDPKLEKQVEPNSTSNIEKLKKEVKPHSKTQKKKKQLKPSDMKKGGN